MKKSYRVFLTPALGALFCVLVLASLAGTTHAKDRAKSNKQKGKQSTKVIAKGGTSRNSKITRSTARNRGALAKTSRSRLAARRRAAIIAARMRALRARDEALRNSAAA